MSARTTWNRNFWKNRIQNTLVPETNSWCKNKLDSFENLIGQNSHVPLHWTMSAHFDFVLRKNKSCIWSRSSDMVTFAGSLSHFSFFQLVTPSSRQLDSFHTFKRSASDNSPRTSSDAQSKMGASKNKFIAIIKLAHLPHFKIINFTSTSKSLHTTDTHV